MTVPAYREAPKVETSEFPLTTAAPLISYLYPDVSSSSWPHHHLSLGYISSYIGQLRMVVFIFHFSHSSFPSVSSTDNMLFKTWDFYIGSFLCLVYLPLFTCSAKLLVILPLKSHFSCPKVFFPWQDNLFLPLCSHSVLFIPVLWYLSHCVRMHFQSIHLHPLWISGWKFQEFEVMVFKNCHYARFIPNSLWLCLSVPLMNSNEAFISLTYQNSIHTPLPGS